MKQTNVTSSYYIARSRCAFARAYTEHDLSAHSVSAAGILSLVPGKLINLLELMEKLNFRSWLFISEYITTAEITRQADPAKDIAVLQAIKLELLTLGFVSSIQSADWIIAQLRGDPPPDRDEVGRMHGELKRRIRDEASRLLFLQVSPNHAQFYEDPLLFGEEVAQNFPSASREITEAGKCLALERNTACVFHLMRVIEVGLQTLTSALRIRAKTTNMRHLATKLQEGSRKIR